MTSEEERILSCNYLVNAMGPWGAALPLMAGVGDEASADPVLRVPLPISPRKRCIFVFKCPTASEYDFPLLVDYTGPYFRCEGGRDTFIAGVSPPKVRFTHTVLRCTNAKEYLHCARKRGMIMKMCGENL